MLHVPCWWRMLDKHVSTANTCTVASWHQILVFLQRVALVYNTSVSVVEVAISVLDSGCACTHITSLNFRTEVLLAEASWYSYWSDTKTGDSSVTSYPSLSVIIPGPHLSLALARIALDDVPALNFKTAEPQTRIVPSQTCTRRGVSATMLAWQGLKRVW